MKAVYSDLHLKHHPKAYFRGGAFQDPPDIPARAEAIRAAMLTAGHDFVEAEDHGAAPRAGVHTPAYLGFLRGAHERWQSLGAERDEVLPNIHPGRHMASLPSGLLGQIGYFTTDMSSPIGAHTYEAACASANLAVHATRLVLGNGAMGNEERGEAAAYALCRPPGHHAFADQAGGFCFLNNIAIAAEYALGEVRRVAILDVDVHHGNGTQSIFYRRREVLTVSLHCDSDDFYPFFAGAGHELGEAEGAGLNLNLPLPKGVGDNSYLDALAGALAVIGEYAPDMLLVALGFDGYEHDPFEGFNITTEGFGRIAGAIAELGLPTVLIQEGGYNVDDLGRNVTSFLERFEAVHAGALAKRG
ncbi:MAG: histone deacetylase family protein [Alphaproteobacteria bacterium]